MRQSKQPDLFVNGPHSNAARIPDELWNELKPEILEIYQKKDVTLEKTMELMGPHWLKHKRTPPTRRQYVHRLGKIWGVRKYQNAKTKAKERGEKQPQKPKKRPLPTPSPPPVRPIKTELQSEPLPFNPPLADPVDRARALRLAEVLLALGDTHYSFLINAALHEWEPSVDRVVACARIVQTAEQADVARQMLDAHTGKPWAADDKSWERILFLVLSARCYDHPPFLDSGLIQIEKVVLEIVGEDEEGRECLVDLGYREPRFDIRLYQFLSFTLERYNEPTDEDERLLDVGRVLGQFRDKQLARAHERQGAVDPKLRSEPLDELSCLTDMLDWCLTQLIKDQHVPVPLVGSTAGEVNQILCRLWTIWIHSSQDQLEEKIHKQLGISPTELLSIVVGMMIAAGGQTDELTFDLRPRALKGAQILKGLKRKKLFEKFLRKVYSISLELMSPVDDANAPGREATVAKSLNPFRTFVAKQLGIDDLPELPDGFNVSQLLIPDVDYNPTGDTDSQSGGSRRSSPGLLNAQVQAQAQPRPRSKNGITGANNTNGNRKVNGKDKEKEKDDRNTHSGAEDTVMSDAPDANGINSGRHTPPYD